MNFVRSIISILYSVKRSLRRSLDNTSYSWLDRTKPFSRKFGLDRGSAIDRVFIERFLIENKSLIQGSVLEIGDDQYTMVFGSELNRSVVLGGGSESIPGDLTDSNSLIPLKGPFDCIISTQVLNFIYDFDAAISGLAYLCKKKTGVCLCTVAGVSQISLYDYNKWGDYWRFNDMSIRRAFEKYFQQVEITTFGNAPLAAAFIMGLSVQEVPICLFEHQDLQYQIVICIKATIPMENIN